MKRYKMMGQNFGFSLVELIVVVLIMGIISVVLAPQIMKWVGRAKTNSDASVARDLKVTIQTAVGEFQGEKGTFSELTNIDISSAGLTTVTAMNGDGDKTLGEYIAAALGNEYPTALGGDYFKFSLTANGVVTITY